jgi:hypothetical protein
MASLLKRIVDKKVLKRRNVCSEAVPHVVLYKTVSYQIAP